MVLEYGIDYRGEMDVLLDIVCPDLSMITGVDKVHSLQIGDPDQIA
jgi:UDP-N-acetylmuramyl pentapeptide synthase